jgi:hypothetical protein
MGNTTSSDPIRKYYSDLTNRVAGSKKIGSGYHDDDEVSIDSLIEYTGGYRKRGKKNLHETIKHMFENDFKIKGGLNNIPSPKRGRSFPGKYDVQKKAYETIGRSAEKLGYDYHNELTGSNVNGLANTVHTVTGSLGEEVGVLKRDLERIIKNMKALRHLLERSFNHMVSGMEKCKNKEANFQLDAMRKLYLEVLSHFDHQLAKLENLVDVNVKVTEAEVRKIVEEGNDLKSLIEKIEYDPGTQQFGDKLTYLLSGIGNMAILSMETNKALKDIGMSMKEFLSERGAGLNESVVAHIRDHIDTDLKGNWEKLVDIMRTIESASYRREDIAKFLDSDEGRSLGIVGGLDIKKNIEKRDDARKVLLQSFAQRLRSILHSIEMSAEIMTKKVGTDIPLSEKVENFIKSLRSLSSESPTSQYGIFYALTGYAQDQESKNRKEKFMGQLQYVIDTLELLKSESYGQYFNDLLTGFLQFRKSVEDFSTVFSKGLGSIVGSGVWDDTKEHAKNLYEKNKDHLHNMARDSLDYVKDNLKLPNEKHGGDGCSACMGGDIEYEEVEYDTYTGGAQKSKKTKKHKKGGCDNPKVGGDDVAEINSLWYSLENTIQSILDAYVRMKIKQNLSYVSKEWKTLTDKYDDNLARSVAKKRQANLDRYRSLKTELDAANDSNGSYSGPTMGGYANIMSSLDEDNKKKFYTETSTWIDRVSKTKDNLWRVAEEVDKFLRLFTENVTLSLDDLLDIQSMFDSVQTINQWFNETTGNQIAALFEIFPDNGSCVDKKVKDIISEIGTSDHYYKWLEDRYTSNHTLPYDLGTGSHEIKNKYDQAMNVMKGFYALKNLISIIFQIGSKFKGQQIYNQLTMKPQEVYTCLVDYIVVSAFNSTNSVLEKSSTTSLGQLEQTLNDFILDIYTRMELESGIFPPDTREKLSNTNSLLNRVSSLKEVCDRLRNNVAISVREVDSVNFLKNKLNEYTEDTPENLKQKQKISMLTILKSIFGNGGPLANPIVLKIVDNVANESGMKVGGDGACSNANVEFKFVTVNNSTSYAEFSETNDLFLHILKSLIAKPLQVLNVRELFTEPLHAEDINHRNRQFTYTRVYMGGADRRIIPEAVDLYVRIPLLIEYYKKLFNEFGLGTNRITMIPELSSKFGTLFKVILERSDISADYGVYSQFDTDIIINEVNKLYESYKASNNPLQDCIHDIVDEVNRRFGIIKQEEYAAYRTELYNVVNNPAGDDPNTLLELSILPGGEAAKSNSILPSDRLIERDIKFEKMDDKIKQINVVEGKYTIDELIARVNNSLKVDGKNLNDLNLASLIKYKKDEILSSPEHERYNKVIQTINSVGIATNIMGNKINLMFEQTIRPATELLYLIYNTYTNILSGLSSRESLTVINAITALSSKPIKMSVNSGQLLVDYSDLKELIERVFMYIDGWLSKFRPYLRKGEMDDFEYKSVVPYYKLKELLVDNLLNGRNKDGSPFAYNTLVNVNRVLINATNGIVGKLPTESNAPVLTSQNLYDAISRFDRAPINVTASRFIIPSEKSLVAIAFGGDRSYVGNVPVGSVSSESEFDKMLGYKVTKISYTYEYNPAAPGLGVVYMFNSLLFHYVKTFTSLSTNKIYSPLIMSLANGYMNNAVYGDESYSDMEYGSLTLPVVATPAYALSRFLAMQIRFMTTRRNQKDKLTHIESDLTEVPLYMKESFKCHLPRFIQLFEALIGRCKLLRVLVSESNLFDVSLGALGSDDDSSYGWASKDSNMKNVNVSLLDQIMNYCTGIITSADSVLKEIDDVPVYMSLYTNFIRDYEVRNGKLPVMPITSAFKLLDVNLDEVGKYNLILPYSSFNTNEFKLQFGCRLLTESKYEASIDSMPWVKKLLGDFNNSVDSIYTINQDEYSGMIKSIVSMFRNLYQIDTTQIVAPLQSGTGAVSGQAIRFGVEPLGKDNIVKVISITESSDDTEKELLTIGGSTSHSRENAMIKNIYELEIVPINVYAIMRDVPLTTIYVYSNMFDALCEKLLSRPVDTMNASVSRPRELMLSLLVNPYDNPGNSEEGIRDIFIGNVDMSLGRPRFLSEQMYNKVLLRSVYFRSSNYDSNPYEYVDNKNMGSINYVKDNKLKPVNIGDLHTIGTIYAKRLRTKFIRDLMFVTNAQRLMAYAIRKVQEKSHGKLRIGENVISPEATEYFEFMDNVK